MAQFTITKGSESFTENWTVNPEHINDILNQIEIQVNEFLNSSKLYAQDPTVRKMLNQLIGDITEGKITEDTLNELYLGIWWPRLTTDKRKVGLELYNDDDFSFDAAVNADYFNIVKVQQTPEDSVQDPSAINMNGKINH